MVEWNKILGKDKDSVIKTVKKEKKQKEPRKCENCNYILNQKKIKCDICPYGKYGECGAFRCLTIDEWKVLNYYFEEKYKNEQGNKKS